MRKTIFTGLTVLGPEDSIFADGAAFTTRDRDEIDRGLKIGIKTHRHTGIDGLTDPILAPSAAIVGSAGTIDAGISITLGYTLEDPEGGETLISPLAVVTTPVPLDVPLNAPVGEVDYTAGSLLIDSYTYGVTYTDGAGGETPLGPTTLLTREPGFANARVKLTGLTAGMEEAGAVAWRLFRARGGGVFALIATGDDTEDEFLDDGTISPDCDTHPPTDNLNNTNKINTLEVTLPKDGLIEDATFINLYATTSGQFSESSLLARYPVASAGNKDMFTSLNFLSSQPPDVNRSYGGANQIDPDTELLDWHWKRPVNNVGDLPEEAEEGDVRAILEAAVPTLYMFFEGEWQQLQSGGGGGGGSGSIKDVLASGGIAPHHILDPFNGSEIDPEWNFILGAYEFEEDEDLTESGGGLHPTSKASKGAIYRSDAEYANGEFLFKFRMNTTPGFSNEIGVFPKWIDKNNYIEMRLIWVEGAEGSSFEFFCFSGGEETIFGTGKWANELQPDTDYWVVSEINGAVLKITVYDEDPTEGSPTPFETFEHTLTGSKQTPLIDALGFPGIGLNGETSLIVDFWEMDVPGLDYAEEAERIVFVGSGGIDVGVEEDGKDAVVTIDAPLMTSGMGVIIIKKSEKGIARPTDYRIYTWFCKEEPTNLGEFDIWIEEGP